MSRQVTTVVLLLLGVSCRIAGAMEFKYHSLDEVNSFVHRVASEHGSLVTLQLLGKTLKGRSIWQLIISNRAKEDGLIPNLHLIANIYGNDLVTREVALHLVEYITKSENTDKDVHWLLNNVRLHVVPSVNVDGSDASIPGDCSSNTGGENVNGIAINRNFPGAFDRRPVGSRLPVEPESAAVLRLERAYPAVLTVLLFAGLHGVLYPYDDTPGADMPWLKTSATPDDDVFQELSSFMAKSMALNATSTCPGKPPVGENGEGFSNGANFYRISGSLADYTYAYEGALPLSVYIGCCKFDDPRSLKGLFENNRRPLLKLLRHADMGVRGTVVNRRGEPVAGALLTVQNRTIGFRTNPYGEFWRILLPGFYLLLVSADGYLPAAMDFQVNEGHVTTLQVKLYTGYKHEL
ncbi:carboxypeptidase M-like [Haemaphysalis longicornis]